MTNIFFMKGTIVLGEVLKFFERKNRKERVESYAVDKVTCLVGKLQ